MTDNIHNINELNKKLIDILLSQQDITENDYKRVRTLHNAQNQSTNTILTALGIVSEQDIADTLTPLMGSNYIANKND